MQDQNDALQQQLAESNKQINKLMNTISSQNNNNNSASNPNAEIEIYKQMVQQQQLQIKHLMRCVYSYIYDK